jgi:hypothetical protein
MATTAVRVSDELLEDVKRVGAIRGEKVGSLLARAWAEYVAQHRDEIANDFENVARMLREDDREGLVAFAKRDVHRRAAAAADRAT